MENRLAAGMLALLLLMVPLAAAAQGSTRPFLSADARQSMILNMQGKKQESQAIIAKMSEANQMAAMNAALDLFKKCAGRGR